MNNPHRLMIAIALTLLCCLNAHAGQNTLTEVERAKIMHEAWGANAPVPALLATVNQRTQVMAPKEELKPSVLKEASEFPTVFEQQITLKSINTTLSDLIKSIGRATHHNAILGPGVEDKKISVDLKGVSIEKALKNILFPLNYGFKAQHGALIILAQETRVFRVILPPVTQGFSDTISNESFVQPQDTASGSGQQSAVNQQVKLGAKVIVENSSQGISFWDDVGENLKTLLSLTGKFSINKSGGSVIVSDTSSVLDKVASYFEDLNKRVTQQIEVDVKVVEVSFNDENRLGIDWNALAQNLKTLNSAGFATNFASGNFTGGNFFTFSADGSNSGSGVSTNGVRFVLDALAKQGKVEVVSQPRVVMLNNQVSIIQVGSTQSFVDRSSIETTQTGTVVSVSTSQVQEGVTMRLLGNIVGDQIYLSVAPVVTTIDKIRTITSGNTTVEAPQTTTKSINTLVKLQEGQTVAIGGLITTSKATTKEGVPGISKMPVLGRLFEYNSKKENKSELIIFITPKKV